MTLRLSDEQAADLELVARVDVMTVSETVRAAIDAYTRARRRDEGFRARLQDAWEAERRRLEDADRPDDA